MIPALPWLSALSDIVVAETCVATAPPWVGLTLSLYGRGGQDCRGTDPAKGLALDCKFGIAQTVHSLPGDYESKVGSAQRVCHVSQRLAVAEIP